jgi:hypothetical protein
VSAVGDNAVNARVAAAADRAGNVYVAWVDASAVDFGGSGDARIEIAASRDGGRSFAAPTTIATSPSGCGANDDCGHRYPQLSITAAAAGVVHAVWSAAPYPDPASVFVVRSRNFGRTWSGLRRVARPPGTADHDEHAPAVAVAPRGRLDLAWVDEARTADQAPLDVYLTHSVDGGSTFAKPARLDAAPTAAPPFGTAVDVAASDGAANAAWDASALEFTRLRDASPPRAPTVAGPGSVAGGRVTYRLRSADDFTPLMGLRFLCAFDGAPLHPCATPYTQTLRRGVHVFRVRALDGAGNRSSIRRVVVRVT